MRSVVVNVVTLCVAPSAGLVMIRSSIRANLGIVPASDVVANASVAAIASPLTKKSSAPRRKLAGSIAKAFEKRSTSLVTLEQVVDEIVHDLETGGREVQSADIGAKVLEKLRGIDEVAYLRYASVHRRFEDVDQFVDAIQALGRRVKPDTKQRELFPPEQVNHGRV